jgi:hypothetical protein
MRAVAGLYEHKAQKIAYSYRPKAETDYDSWKRWPSKTAMECWVRSGRRDERERERTSGR